MMCESGRSRRDNVVFASAKEHSRAIARRAHFRGGKGDYDKDVGGNRTRFHCFAGRCLAIWLRRPKCKNLRPVSHSHDPVYKTGAFASRPRQQTIGEEIQIKKGCSARIELVSSAFTGPHANHYTTNTTWGRFSTCHIEQAS